MLSKNSVLYKFLCVYRGSYLLWSPVIYVSYLCENNKEHYITRYIYKAQAVACSVPGMQQIHRSDGGKQVCVVVWRF